MEEIFKTLDEGYIKYKNKTIGVVIDNDDVVWFNAKDSANTLEYSNHINAINMHTQKRDRTQLQNINYDGYAGHPHSLYLNEAGLYKLIIRSRMPAAEKFTDWVTYEVLPSIRKYGYYKISKGYKDTVRKLNIQLKRLKTIKKNVDKENTKLRQNLKKEKFPKGGLVYAVDYSTDEEEIYRIGMTSNMNKRKEVIDTHTLDKRPVLFYMLTSCPLSLEMCVRGLLYKFRYKDRKDFFICSLKRIKIAFKSCSEGTKKIGYKNKPGSKTNNKKQKGGTISFHNSIIIMREIKKVSDEIHDFQTKINKLHKKIYNIKNK